MFSNLNGSRDEIGDSLHFEPFWAGCAAVQNTVGGNESRIRPVAVVAVNPKDAK